MQDSLTRNHHNNDEKQNVGVVYVALNICINSLFGDDNDRISLVMNYVLLQNNFSLIIN